MKGLKTAVITAAILGCSLTAAAADQSDAEQQFVTDWQAKGVDSEMLHHALSKAQKQQKIIDSITRPWEAKPWYQYRKLFLTEERLAAGTQFWQENKSTLEAAYERFGVEPEIIVAIIGVETYYGRHKGTWSVLDALYTLGFHYPPRQSFFRKELGYFLQLAQEQNWQLDEPKGSYAGAMGWGQFIPSSYLAYAVDFDDDGKRDLFNNKADAIGSVANYFARHKWQAGQPVTTKVDVADAIKVKPLLWNGKKLSHSSAKLNDAGVQLGGINADKLGLLALDISADSKQHFVVHPNFYAITRYNHSPLYAMAVWQFSQQLKQAQATP
ncbi:lytic murein transglycosylase B [Ferrimonas lipolytica]|uniref:Lytic murein transglycosylase B n=1 Tax=Ferrimonas lipolytica TaxID=2724191 RepID=A0A6H1UG34_9GAMM|nr:lytic murein transglycosylase B [Ferrimonas lipolytica]QIZ77589.1 lytic murein transglycosylase B [Ferrimonas lipolytica]